MTIWCFARGSVACAPRGTEPQGTVAAVSALIDTAAAYDLHPKVALRPEPFGALAYHYGNRKLVFLRSPRMVALVKSLPSHGSVDDALAAAGVTVGRRDAYVAALASLAESNIICTRTTSNVDGNLDGSR